jgi:hypothetical protein
MKATLQEFLAEGVRQAVNRPGPKPTHMSMRPGMHAALSRECGTPEDGTLTMFMGLQLYVSDAVPPGTALLYRKDD